MDIIDSKYVDLSIVGGEVQIKVPLIALLEQAALASANKFDDSAIALLKSILEKLEAPKV